VDLADRWVSPLWLSHHFPEDYDRCVRLGRAHVCRRCLALYPLAIVVMVIGLVFGPTATNDSTWSLVAMIVLPLPAVAEFVLEHLGILGYRPARQVVATMVMAVALGLGFARYLRHPTDLWFWGVVALYGGSCLLAALSGRRVPYGTPGVEAGTDASTLGGDEQRGR